MAKVIDKLHKQAHSFEKLSMQQIQERLIYYSMHRDEIDQRIEELNREWDIERVLEAKASAITLFGLMRGFSRSRRWFLLPLLVQGFMMQHAVKDWGLAVPFLRNFGLRTKEEIEHEKYALKLLRGDFEDLEIDNDYPHSEQIAAQLLDAVVH